MDHKEIFLMFNLMYPEVLRPALKRAVESADNRYDDLVLVFFDRLFGYGVIEDAE